jgi:hypothetical protein
MNPKPFHLIEATSISEGWREAFFRVRNAKRAEMVPLLVSINFLADAPIENVEIRNSLDADLAKKKLPSCSTVAGTIFPYSMWNASRPRDTLFERYADALPIIKRYPQNRNGVYFERMTEFGTEGINQLKFMLESHEKGNHRRSAMQIGIVDPSKDMTNQRVRGFPCLQQVSFAPYGDNDLAVHGFYGSQYIYQKAYGNYLGLRHLGTFVAHELGRRLTQLHCFTGIAQLGVSKASVSSLASNLLAVPKGDNRS